MVLVALAIINILALCGLCFTWGYFIGKGKIEVKRKLTDAEKKELEEAELNRQKEIEKYNNAIDAIISYAGGDE